jgi:hypothetical protein
MTTPETPYALIHPFHRPNFHITSRRDDLKVSTLLYLIIEPSKPDGSCQDIAIQRFAIQPGIGSFVLSNSRDFYPAGV